MSEKSICRRVRRTLTAARAPRADDPDRFSIATSPECVRDHEHVSTGGSTKPQEPRLRRRVLQVRAIECLGIEEHGHGVLERDAVLRRVGPGLPRIPLEHAFSIYEMHGPARPGCGSRVPMHTKSYAVTSIGFCVRTVSHAPRAPGRHRDLRGHADAHRRCGKSLRGTALVGVDARQHARPASISKRAPSTTRTSLRFRINRLRAVCNQIISITASFPSLLPSGLESAAYKRASTGRRANCVRPLNVGRSLTGFQRSRCRRIVSQHPRNARR
jgi:hypothetical protein